MLKRCCALAASAAIEGDVELVHGRSDRRDGTELRPASDLYSGTGGNACFGWEKKEKRKEKEMALEKEKEEGLGGQVLENKTV